MTKIILLILASASLAHGLTLESAKGSTHFTAIGRPSAIKISGAGIGPAGDLKLTKDGENFLMSGEVQVDLDSFDTGISMRDHHMKEKYLETGKFKTAVLKIQDVKIAADLVKNGGTLKMAGKLLLHGQERATEVEMTLKPGSGNLASQSKFKIKLSDYAIEIPKFSGITVADEVEIRTDTEVPLKALTEGI